MDWLHTRDERVGRAQQLLDQAARLAFEAQLVLGHMGVETVGAAACANADAALRNAKDVLEIIAPAAVA